jgi:hypothetical protein
MRRGASACLGVNRAVGEVVATCETDITAHSLLRDRFVLFAFANEGELTVAS